MAGERPTGEWAATGSEDALPCCGGAGGGRRGNNGAGAGTVRAPKTGRRPGQSAVFYNGDQVIGGGVIDSYE